MRTIPFEILVICCSLFKCNYLKNEKVFVIFFFTLWNLHQILNIFDQKMIVIANLFNMLKGINHFWNLHESIFIIFFHHSKGKWLGWYLPYWNLKYYGCYFTHWLLMRTIPLGILRNCSSVFKRNSLKNEKFFLDFLFQLWNVRQILYNFEKKMVVIANGFEKLQTVKCLVIAISRTRGFRTSFVSQRVNRCQTLVKSAWQQFYLIFWWLWGEMVWKVSALLKFEILEVFVNTLTADEKDPLADCENLQFPIQMILS